MKKLFLKKDIVVQLSSQKQVVGGYNSGPKESCRYGLCVTPKLTTWFEEEKPVGPPVQLSDGEVTCRDSGPNTNPTMASCRYGC